jgi:hypothetical protein
MKIVTEEKVTELHSDFVQTFETPHGKRVYDLLAAFCLKKGCTFVEGSPDKSAFNQGARAVMLEIDFWLEYDLTTLEGTGETDNEEPIERDENE